MVLDSACDKIISGLYVVCVCGGGYLVRTPSLVIGWLICSVLVLYYAGGSEKAEKDPETCEGRLWKACKPPPALWAKYSPNRRNSDRLFSPLRSVTLYFWFYIQESACIVSGLAYNGKDKDGRHLWDGCTNIVISSFEMTGLAETYVGAFNLNTNRWVAKYATFLLISKCLAEWNDLTLALLVQVKNQKPRNSFWVLGIEWSTVWESSLLFLSFFFFLAVHDVTVIIMHTWREPRWGRFGNFLTSTHYVTS